MSASTHIVPTIGETPSDMAQHPPSRKTPGVDAISKRVDAFRFNCIAIYVALKIKE